MISIDSDQLHSAASDQNLHFSQVCLSEYLGWIHYRNNPKFWDRRWP